MPVSPEEYQALLQREMARYGVKDIAASGDARDRAVRSTNIATGYGNSTALQKPKGKAAAAPAAAASASASSAAAAAPTGEAAVPIPTPRPSPIQSLFLARPDLAEVEQASMVPVPTPRPSPIESLFFARPDLAEVQPEFTPEDFGAQGFPDYWGVQPDPPQKLAMLSALARLFA